MIKEVVLKTNIIEFNKHHNEKYENESGILIIERDDGKKYVLDIKAQADLTDCDYIEFIDTENTREVAVFKNIIYDTETLSKLAGK